eukprot:1194626-Prorocentrum_minimum.AAC.11
MPLRRTSTPEDASRAGGVSPAEAPGAADLERGSLRKRNIEKRGGVVPSTLSGSTRLEGEVVACRTAEICAEYKHTSVRTKRSVTRPPATLAAGKV